MRNAAIRKNLLIEISVLEEVPETQVHSSKRMNEGNYWKRIIKKPLIVEQKPQPNQNKDSEMNVVTSGIALISLFSSLPSLLLDPPINQECHLRIPPTDSEVSFKTQFMNKHSCVNRRIPRLLPLQCILKRRFHRVFCLQIYFVYLSKFLQLIAQNNNLTKLKSIWSFGRLQSTFEHLVPKRSTDAKRAHL
ncbi:hypothetical protein L596_014584 [Steinernema carpocapsae]|uniref:Uncharacterized protein n=1 Tax=Steinernema carpocapsae TaxID=34508 RepID=A0A4U5ND46_STECR|nr:hypothetical protein L596_014584 [Steinernema carpocapsae]